MRNDKALSDKNLQIGLLNVVSREINLCICDRSMLE
jgi:hypothetical protein